MQISCFYYFPLICFGYRKSALPNTEVLPNLALNASPIAKCFYIIYCIVLYMVFSILPIFVCIYDYILQFRRNRYHNMLYVYSPYAIYFVRIKCFEKISTPVFKDNYVSIATRLWLIG